MKGVRMNNFVYVTCSIYAGRSFECMSRTGIAGYGISKLFKPFSPSVVQLIYPTLDLYKLFHLFTFSPVPGLVDFNQCQWKDHKCYLVMVLIFISLITNEVDYIFIHLLLCTVVFSMKNPFVNSDNCSLALLFSFFTY